MFLTRPAANTTMVKKVDGGELVKNEYIYNVADVACILKVSTKTVYKLIHGQELNCVWIRGQIRITSEQLSDYLKGGSKP